MMKMIISVLLCFIFLASCNNETKYQTIDEARKAKERNKEDFNKVVIATILANPTYTYPICARISEPGGNSDSYALTTASSEKQNVRFRFRETAAFIKVTIAAGQSVVFDSPAYNIYFGSFLLYEQDSCPVIIRQDTLVYGFATTSGNPLFTASANSIDGTNSQMFIAKKTGTYLFLATIYIGSLPAFVSPSTMTVYVK